MGAAQPCSVRPTSSGDANFFSGPVSVLSLQDRKLFAKDFPAPAN